MDKFVLAIIVANVIMTLKGLDSRNFFDRYKFQIGPIVNKDYIRLLSSGFLHVDYMHLLFNMLTLYFFAPVLIGYLGVGQMLGVYFMSLLAGNLLSLYFHKTDFFYSAVGASGAVSGVLFASILLEPFSTVLVFFIPMPAIVFGVLYIVYSIYGMKNQWGNIGHAAHLGGAFMGLVMTLLYEPSLFSTRPLIILLLFVPLVLLYLFKDKIKL